MEQKKTDSDHTWTSAGKEPPPLGLAGLEAFRREYLTSPLSHLRNMGSCNPLLPPFPPLLPPGLGGSPAPGGGGPEFARNNPNRSSLSGGGTPPSERERGGGGGGGGHPYPKKPKKPPVPSVTCAICDVTVSSEQVYLTHIAGKAHKKKVKVNICFL